MYFSSADLSHIFSSKRRQMFLSLSNATSSGKVQNEYIHAPRSHTLTSSLKNSQHKRKLNHLRFQAPGTPSRNKNQPKMTVKEKKSNY